jgi:hypothetical protein
MAPPFWAESAARMNITKQEYVAEKSRPRMQQRNFGAKWEVHVQV